MTQFDSQDSDSGDDTEAVRLAETAAVPAMRNDTVSRWLAVGGELLGSFLVCFVLYAAYTFGAPLYGTNLAFIAITTGVAYALAVMVLARFSRVQLNPAVTLASVLTSKTSVLDGVLYVIAQVVGAIGAAALFRGILPVSKTLTRKIWLTYAVNGFDKGSVSYSSLNSAGATFGITVAIILELIAVIIIVAAAMSSTDADARPTQGHALRMGLAYALGAALTFPVTGAALNPARSTGIAILAQGQGLGVEPLGQLWVFWMAPVLAAALVSLVLVGYELIADGHADPRAVAGAGGADVDAAKTDDSDKLVSAEHEDAGVEQQQSQSQSDPDNGVERN